ncbi:MAG: hypothetical protein PHU69_11175 [Fermentimonas sp.]|nr:hypothetical protein [Fermentimonas sp.]
MTSTKKVFFVIEVQRQLDHYRYEPIWCMMQKIRTDMGVRDEKYLLTGITEMDEGYFSTVDSEKLMDRKQELKRGRGSEKRTPCAGHGGIQTG